MQIKGGTEGGGKSLGDNSALMRELMHCVIALTLRSVFAASTMHAEQFQGHDLNM